MAASPPLNPHRRLQALPESYPLRIPLSKAFGDGVSARRRIFVVHAQPSHTLKAISEKNIPCGGPRRCEHGHCLPPAGGGPHHHLRSGSLRTSIETPGE